MVPSRGGGVSSESGGKATFTTGTFTVVATTVPKLGLMGMPLVAPSSLQALSKESAQILEGYSVISQSQTARPSLVASAQLNACVGPEVVGPHVEFLSLPDSHSPPRRPHTSRTYKEDENASPVRGAWAPCARHNPPLFRSHSRLPTSPRSHSPGCSVLIPPLLSPSPRPRAISDNCSM